MERHERALNLSVAFVWLATAVLVLHPAYRAIGEDWLERLGLPPWLMWATCAGELALGLRLALGRNTAWLAGLQVALVCGFTVILAVLEPALLAHPLGILSKNLPLLAVVVCSGLLVREGWSPRAVWVLRGGVAVIWVTEGLFPKIFFQDAWELSIVSNSGLVPLDPGLFLVGMGLAQALSGVAVLFLRGRWLRVLLVLQATALVLLPLLVSWQEPALWVHPFGPLTKNLPILVGTLVLCSTSR